MKTMPISEFKARALRAFNQVAVTREGIVVTRRGRPLAMVLPYQEPLDKPLPGRLSDTLVFEKDILTPLGAEVWEAAR